MDIQKIGVFLSELRKEKNLTQDELGEQIGVKNTPILTPHTREPLKSKRKSCS